MGGERARLGWSCSWEGLAVVLASQGPHVVKMKVSRQLKLQSSSPGEELGTVKYLGVKCVRQVIQAAQW